MNIYPLLLVPALFLGGCAGYHPLPVPKPTKIDYELYADKSTNAIPIPKNVPESMKFAWTYGETYRAKKNAIHLSIYNHSDASFFGTVFALLGGVAKAPEAVVAGGAFAAGAEIATSRYQLAVQAANYEKAEAAAVCVFDELRKVELDDQVALEAYEQAIGRSAEKTVGDMTYRAFKIVHARLETAQAKVTLLTPDLQKLQTAMEKKQQTPVADDATGKAVAMNKDKEKNLRLLTDQEKKDLQAAQALAEKGDVLFKKLDSKVEVCLEASGTGK